MFCSRRISVYALCVLALNALATSACRAELISYYNFDDGETVTDSVGDNHGTVIHNAGFVNDTPDGSPFALDLSATGVGAAQDYVRIGPAAEGGGEPEDGRDFGIADSGSFSISAWVNYEQSERGIITIKQDLTSGGSDRSGVTFGIDGQERLFIGIIASTGDDIGDEANGGPTFRDITTEVTVPTNEWVHIAATFDGADDQLVSYINGVAAEFYTVTPAGSIGDDGSDITGEMGIDFFDNDGSFTGFGAAGNGPEHGDSAGDFTRLFYDGFLDDVAIWNEAISAEDIQSLASGDVKPPNLGESMEGDFNKDGSLNVADLDLLAAAMESGANPPNFDLTSDGNVNYDDRLRWVKQLKGTAIGDADLSGSFGTGDLVKIFQAGKFETEANASWAEGDFNGDLKFGTGDLVAAFQDGGFDPNANAPSVPEPQSVWLLIICAAAAIRRLSKKS